MKTAFLLPGAAFFLLLAGCDNDSDLATEALPAASFSSASFSFTESDGEQIVTLNLDKPVQDDGEVIVKILCQGNNPVNTEPRIVDGTIQLPVFAGQSSVAIRILPIDNGKMDGTRKLTMSILSVEGSYRLGYVNQAVVTVADDESPSRVEFAEREGTWNEGAVDGFHLEIRLSAAAPAAGIVILETETDSHYSTDFVTIPSVVNGKIYLPVAEGQRTVSIYVYASNDSEMQPDRQITFRVADASGGVIQDGYAGSFHLRIVEDDLINGMLPLRPSASEDK
jgi:hypothetical protein